MQAFRFELDLNVKETRQAVSHAGGARFAYNWGLDRILKAWDEEEDIGGWSAITLHNLWIAERGNVAPWYDANSKQAYQYALDNLSRAFTDWNNCRKGKRGGSIAIPKKKHKSRSKMSFRYDSTPNYLRGSDYRLLLPRIGEVKTHESVEKLKKVVASGGKIKRATVTCTAGRWFISFAVDIDRTWTRGDPEPTPGLFLGIDLGINYLAVVADSSGNLVHIAENPRLLRNAQVRLRRANKALARSQKNSNRAKRKKLKLQKIHAQVANQRRDAIHKLTSKVTKELRPMCVGMETLRPKNMAKQRTLAQSVSDVAFGEVATQVGYKTRWYGQHLYRADQWYASSQTCSGCEAKTKLPRGERTFVCSSCGLILDRDLNAAINLAKFAHSSWVEAHRLDVRPEGNDSPRQTIGCELSYCQAALLTKR